MSAIKNTSSALAAVERLAAKADPQDAAALKRAEQIITLAGRITYFEAPDPTAEEAKAMGIPTEGLKWPME